MDSQGLRASFDSNALRRFPNQSEGVPRMGVFSQRLRNFPHRRPGPKANFPAKAFSFRSGICVATSRSQGKPRLEQLGAAAWLLKNRQAQEGLEKHTMAKDDRDLLELLKDELAFIQQGGYGRSVRTPWLPKSIFQDSLSCLNYGYPYRAHPCNECRLLEFVSAQDRSQPVPCHFIPLNDSGTTIEDLESQGNELKLESAVKDWLQARISQLEAESANGFWQNVD